MKVKAKFPIVVDACFVVMRLSRPRLDVKEVYLDKILVIADLECFGGAIKYGAEIELTDEKQVFFEGLKE